jgi:cell division protein FtsQ
LKLKISGKYIRMAWVAFIALTVIGLVMTISHKKANEISALKVEITNVDDREKIVNEKHIEEIIYKQLHSSLVGTSLKDLDISAIERVVRADPYVGEADVYLDIENRLIVNIRQREPVLRIKDLKGQDYYLDQSGHFFSWTKNYTPRVMVATGNIPPYQENFMEMEKSLLKDLFQINNFLVKDKFWSRMIQQIHVNNYGEFILVPDIGPHKILLGDANDLQEKFSKLEVFYREGLTYMGWNAYDILDIRFKNQVVGRRI